MGSFVVPDGNIKYVVGIDFGHGETAASYCELRLNDEKCENLQEPRSIVWKSGVNGQSSALPSVMSVKLKRDCNGDIVKEIKVGLDAIEEYKDPRYESSELSFFSYFKKSPSSMNKIDREVMTLFMKTMYEKILDSLGAVLKDGNHVVYIACPSNAEKWSERDLRAYAEIALEAGLPIAKIVDGKGKEQSIGVVRESRAAFLKSRNSSEIKNIIERGAVLIDFGSSTVDLTYYSSDCNAPIDDGYEYGASNVEKIIRDSLLMGESDIRDMIINDSSMSNILLIGIREAKEYYYSSGEKYFDFACRLKRISRQKIKSGFLECQYDTAELESKLDSYVREIKVLFEDFKRKHLSGKRMCAVLLTGGASRMGFVEKTAKEVFKCEAYKGSDPSTSISCGVALAGRADIRIQSMLEKLLNDSSLNKDISLIVIERFVNHIVSAVVAKTSSEYNKFYSSSSDLCLDGLVSEIKKIPNSIGYERIIKNIFNDVLVNEFKNSLNCRLNPIVHNYFPTYELPIPDTCKKITVPELKLPDSFLAACKDSGYECIKENYMLMFCKGLWNVLWGAFSLVEGAIIKAADKVMEFIAPDSCLPPDANGYLDIVGDLYEMGSAGYRDLNTKLSKEQRKDVLDAFNDGKGGLEDNLKRELKKKLGSIISLKTSLNEIYKTTAREYIVCQVNKVRLLLN